MSDKEFLLSVLGNIISETQTTRNAQMEALNTLQEISDNVGFSAYDTNPLRNIFNCVQKASLIAYDEETAECFEYILEEKDRIQREFLVMV